MADKDLHDKIDNLTTIVFRLKDEIVGDEEFDNPGLKQMMREHSKKHYKLEDRVVEMETQSKIDAASAKKHGVFAGVITSIVGFLSMLAKELWK